VCLPEEEFDQKRTERKLSDFPVDDGTTRHHLLIHIGIYRVTNRETDVSVMFDRAHMAVSTIKEEYHITAAWYDEEMRNQVLWNRQISAELKDAIWQGQIRPWLQPIVDRNGKTIGAEALVRWVHPKDGIRPPSSFIPVFERNGMIADVDRHMWRCCCSILRKWQQEGDERFISVNISPKDFKFLDVGEELIRMVREFGVEPGKLRLEITETVMMTNLEQRMETLESLRKNGFIIEMDDFGSGYSSLNMLKDMPVDVLKIDLAFLRKAADAGGRGKTIVREIINLARELDIISLTEGVETKDQYDQLQAMGCQMYQGYFFAKPMPLEDFEKQFGAAG
jgi:EAL domain-containing protein (putative c-di-GMP-specific phosphodiesterase class I)